MTDNVEEKGFGASQRAAASQPRLGVRVSPSAIAERVLDAHWDGWVPVNLNAIATSLGLTVRIEVLEGLSGFIEDGVITINSNEPTVRQRFTLAHEIGHAVMNHGTSRREDPASNFRAGIADPKEVAANAFAAALLMPRLALDVEVHGNGVTSVTELAKFFRVSEAAMEYRLKNLGWL